MIAGHSRVVAPRGLPWAASLAVVASLSAGGRALAQQVGDGAPPADTPEEGARAVRASSDPGRFLPGAPSAAAGKAIAAGITWGGYDAAAHAPLLGASAEARLGSRVVVGLGATYTGGPDGQPRAMRPDLLLRVQVLDQQRHAVDGSVAVVYRQDRYFREEGFFQAAALVGRHFGDGGWLMGSLAYGRDGEGDDHEGELRLAALQRVGRALHVGVDGHGRWLLSSTDPNRAAHGTPSWECAVGPAAVLTLGPLALMVETGWAGQRAGRTESGVLALGGLGAVF